MILFDSHCHLTAEQFDADREDVHARALAGGVERMLTVASTLEDSQRVVALVRALPGLRGSVGVHPHAAGDVPPEAVIEIRQLALEEPAIAAIGETGFDFFYDNAPRIAQEAWFERQVHLADELNLPLIVHSRDADDETSKVLRELPSGVRGVLHCFTGGRRLLDAALEADWYVSFSGVVTFRNFAGQDLLRAVPLNRLLIETDSPYLAPIPMRGKRNEPAFVRHVCESIALHLGGEAVDIATLTAENAEQLFPVRDPGARTARVPS